MERVIEFGDLPSLGNGGDFDADSDVDGADFLTWQRTLANTVPPASDPNGDGVITAADLGVWKNNFGSTAAQPFGAAVPEPGAETLLAAGGAGRLSPPCLLLSKTHICNPIGITVAPRL
jgi:hypothetical protein